MIGLKLFYTCVAIAFAPPPIVAHPEITEAVEMLHCGRSTSRDECERQGRRAVSRLLTRWQQWGHRAEIDDFEVVCDETYMVIP